MATAGEKFMKSLLNVEVKEISKQVGYSLNEWENADTVEMTEAMVIVAARRNGEKVTMDELDQLTLEQTGTKFEELLAKLGFEDDEEDPKVEQE